MTTVQVPAEVQRAHQQAAAAAGRPPPAPHHHPSRRSQAPGPRPRRPRQRGLAAGPPHAAQPAGPGELWLAVTISTLSCDWSSWCCSTPASSSAAPSSSLSELWTVNASCCHDDIPLGSCCFKLQISSLFSVIVHTNMQISTYANILLSCCKYSSV